MMRAMVLAAGEGRRMRPLTQTVPKPLLKVAGQSLLERHLRALAAAGVESVVVNASWLADQIVAFCGDGRQWGLRISMSVEATPLETAGGIIQARDLLGEKPFLVVSADVFTDLDYKLLLSITPPRGGAHLLMVDNPAHHLGGDFALLKGRLNLDGRGSSMTYSGLGVFCPTLFSGYEPGKRALRPLLEAAARAGRLTGEPLAATWCDVGTPERLDALNARMAVVGQD
jgi:MurNAc alpha-1-phosphate uridylyltransferase